MRGEWVDTFEAELPDRTIRGGSSGMALQSFDFDLGYNVPNTYTPAQIRVLTNTDLHELTRLLQKLVDERISTGLDNGLGIEKRSTVYRCLRWCKNELCARKHVTEFTYEDDQEILSSHIRLSMISPAHPERYQAFLGRVRVGYANLRYGTFSVWCPRPLYRQVTYTDLTDIDGYNEYSSTFKCDSHRVQFLDLAVKDIAAWCNTTQGREFLAAANRDVRKANESTAYRSIAPPVPSAR